jgi:hypothetical protein
MRSRATRAAVIEPSNFLTTPPPPPFVVCCRAPSPRSDNRRTSGTNAGDAASDWQWGFERNDVGTTRRAKVHVAMMKDGVAEGTEWEIELIPYRLGTSSKGKPIEACAVEMITPPGQPTEDVSELTARAQKAATLTPKRQQMFDMVREALADTGQYPDKAAGARRRGDRARAAKASANLFNGCGWPASETDAEDRESVCGFDRRRTPKARRVSHRLARSRDQRHSDRA